MDYLQLANTSALYAPLLQVPNEITGLMEYLDTEIKPQNFLEIGVCMGGTYFLWSYLAQPGGVKLGIEYPNGPWGVPEGQELNNKQLDDLKRRLQSIAPSCHILYKDSQSVSAFNWVVNKLDGKKLDFLFIDGDHSYEGVKKDYETYLPLVRKGGIIAMHDIKDTLRHRRSKCTVSDFWKELKGDKIVFIDDNYDWGGIGVIKV